MKKKKFQLGKSTWIILGCSVGVLLAGVGLFAYKQGYLECILERFSRKELPEPEK